MMTKLNLNTDVKLIIILVTLLLCDSYVISLALQHHVTKYIIIVLALVFFLIILFSIVKIIMYIKNKSNNDKLKEYKNKQIAMSLLLEQLHKNKNKYLYASEKLYKILPITNNYFYYAGLEHKHLKIKVIKDKNLKDFEFKTNNIHPYINNINDIYK